MITTNDDKWNIFHIVVNEKNLSILRNLSMCLDYEPIENILTDMVDLYIQDTIRNGTIDEKGMIEGLKNQ